MSTAPLAFMAFLGAAGSLSGCAPQDVGFGDSVKHNIALQVIDPDPHYQDASVQPGGSGDKAAKAVERYRKGEVIQPVTTSTSNLRTTGAGQSGSSQSGGGAPPR